MEAELKALREEVVGLRREIEALRADRAIHHYHHQAAPAPLIGPQPIYPWTPGYLPTTCGGEAVGIGTALSAARAAQ